MHRSTVLGLPAGQDACTSGPWTVAWFAASNWLVPPDEGVPFFDKPVLFTWLQLAFSSLLGADEFAARLVPALAGLGLSGCESRMA